MILVCGEALMDVFEAGVTPTGLTLDARVGGSPFNVAVGLARLGQASAMLTGMSRGFLGDRLFRALEEEGVATHAVHRLDAPTTLSLIGLDSQGVPSYAFYGEGGADRRLPLDACEKLSADIAAIHLGSYAAVVEPVASTLRHLVDLRHGGTVIAYDPNVRLKVEPELAQWRVVLQWMATRAHLIKISEEDLALLHPGSSPEDFARDALKRGVELVVVTRGGEGALGWTAQAQAKAASIAVEVVDTVGAGDTFQAALLTWLAEHDALRIGALARLSSAQLHEALHFASRAAAITCSRRGADLPRRRELA